MRILTVGSMYPPHHLGGYELTWESAVNRMRGMNWQVRVLASDFRTAHADAPIPEKGYVFRELRWYWRAHEFPRLSPRERLAIERHNQNLLRRHLREWSPDGIIWWAMGGMSLSLIETTRRRGLAAIGVVGDDWMVYGPRVDGWMRAFRRRRAAGRIATALTGIPSRVELGSAAQWLFNSRATHDRACQAGWSLKRAQVAHPGVDPKLFPRGPDKPWHGRLLYVGRLDPRKGIEVAIRALEELPAATLTVIGSGDEVYGQALWRLVTERRLDTRVTFGRCPRDRLATAYARADAVIFPVLWEEPWGLVPLEAMSVGTPVVATGTGGSGEYLRDGKNCVIYRPRDDPAALASAVRRFETDPRLRRRLREEGFLTAARFTEDDYNAAIVKALEKEIETGHGATANAGAAALGAGAGQ